MSGELNMNNDDSNSNDYFADVEGHNDDDDNYGDDNYSVDPINMCREDPD